MAIRQTPNAKEIKLTVSSAAFSGIDLDPSITTDGFPVSGYTRLGVTLEYTYNAATDVSMYVEYSIDGGSTWFRGQDISVSSGTGTSSDASWVKSVSADDDWIWTLNLDAAGHARLVFDATGATASDLLTCKAMLVKD